MLPIAVTELGITIEPARLAQPLKASLFMAFTDEPIDSDVMAVDSNADISIDVTPLGITRVPDSDVHCSQKEDEMQVNEVLNFNEVMAVCWNAYDPIAVMLSGIDSVPDNWLA